MTLTLQTVIAAFGESVKRKLASPAARGNPEDQLRSPFESLLSGMAQLARLEHRDVTLVGESSVADLKTRPDFAVAVKKALAGFIELKAPGKGADPRRFQDPHDKEQWEKLRSLPNLMYTDGNAFSLWQDGALVGEVVVLEGDIATAGSRLKAPQKLVGMFESFLRWKPVPPRNAKELALTSARLCRLLRDEVTEQLAKGTEALTALATDWRRLLFPEATDAKFADGYAQAVTFGMLMARAKKISLTSGLQGVARELSNTSSLIGAALKLLTDDVGSQETLKTSVGTLTRVLEAVDWNRIAKGEAEVWLYFYENFLEVYDNDLRKQTGSYYTPPEVVSAMVELVDEALRSHRFGLSSGLAAPAVTLADPATGTGTFMLGVLRKIADTVRRDEGPGAVSEAINAAIKRLIAFELQLGPFAVAQLRILAEVMELTETIPSAPLRMFVTNTLGNPNDEEGWIPSFAAPIAESRRQANKIKREEPITVVIGNPPYKEKAKGMGGWVESDKLAAWQPPREWGAGVHAKHLRNLYIYFWRWATWKVFDQHPDNTNGVVCFITMAGFLNGPGFQRMREYLRQKCDDIWVVDGSPEGHRPKVNTRIFQGVKQPVCIVIASRSGTTNESTPARVRFRALPLGQRTEKFAALGQVKLADNGWVDCPTDWRAGFLPASVGAWSTYPALEDFFAYNGSGVMPGRTWVIAPDSESLKRRWSTLVAASSQDKERLFHPHGGGDRGVGKVVKQALPGFKGSSLSVATETGACEKPIRYGFRSFDRQWIIPDYRLINRPNPELWRTLSSRQIYLTAPSDRSPTNGPALSLCAHVPDLHHYHGRGGRVFPLWSDRKAATANFRPNLLGVVSSLLGTAVQAEDLFAYIAGVAAHPAYTVRFQGDLSTPGLRIPLTRDLKLFQSAAAVGRRVIWLHTFGERMADPADDRPASPPRLPNDRRPTIPANGAIPQDPALMPNSMSYDAATKRLYVGAGFIDNVALAIWDYQVSGMQVILQWFSYRKKDRSRPLIGERRKPSPLGDVQSDHWLAEYTTELINLINVLGLLVELEPMQAKLLEDICNGPTITRSELDSAGALQKAAKPKGKKSKSQTTNAFSDDDE